MFPPFMQWFLLVNKMLANFCMRVLTGQINFGESIDLLKSTSLSITRPNDRNFTKKFEGELLSKEEYEEYIGYAHMLSKMSIIPGQDRYNVLYGEVIMKKGRDDNFVQWKRKIEIA